VAAGRQECLDFNFFSVVQVFYFGVGLVAGELAHCPELARDPVRLHCPDGLARHNHLMRLLGRLQRPLVP
jgi:hypothetical protein